MDYKKKYKEANDKVAIRFGTNVAKEIFTDLYESEDERIKKALIEHIKANRTADYILFKKFSSDDVIAWLEKQGERKPVNDTDEDIVEAVKDTSILDMVEPKFKVGDIVQYITDSTDRRKIEEVDTLCNMYHTDSSPIMFEIEDEWKVVVNAEDVEQKPAWSE